MTKRILQDAKTDPNGNVFPFTVFYREDFGSYAGCVVESFATEKQAVERGEYLTEQGFVVNVFEDVAYTTGA